VIPRRPRSLPELARQGPLVGWLVLVWVLLWGTWTVANLVTGLVVAVFVTVLLPLPPVVRDIRLHPRGIARFVVRFVRDLVVSSLQVAWLAVRPAPPPPNAVIGVRLRSRSDVVIVVTAEAQTLVPGSIVIEIDPESSTLYCHVLNVRTAADVQAFRDSVVALEQRVLRAIASASVTRQAEAGPQPAGRWGGHS
jgi:multicomponent Na+:H+ antiporter subunit E